MEEVSDLQDIEPLIHTFSTQQAHTGMQNALKCLNPPSFFENSNSTCKSHLILIPSEDKDGNHREFLQKVYSYPQGAVSTVIEKSSDANIINGKDVLILKPTDGEHKENFYIKKKGSIYSSSNSISSSISSKRSTHSSINASSAHNKKCSHPIFETSSMSFHSAIPRSASNVNLNQMKNFNDVKVSNKYRDSESLSDYSSNLSNASDLSAYDDEYSAIRRVVSDIPITHRDQKAIFLQPTSKISQTDKRLTEQDLLIRSLYINKEDLEIQVHRLSVQLQNSVREKETCLEQLEINQAKMSENCHKDYFQVQKEKATVEGQYEALKHEFENCSVDKNLLQVKVFDLQNKLLHKEKETELFKNLKNNLESCYKELETKGTDNINEIMLLKNEILNYKDTILDIKKELEIHKTKGMNCESTISDKNTEITELKYNIEKIQELNSAYKAKEDQINQKHKHLENKLSEAHLQIKALKENQEYLHTQLHIGQKLQSDLQIELTDTKGQLAVISADRDRIKVELDRVNFAIEESRANLVREKSSLLMQLEEVEADMKEREAAMTQFHKENSEQHVQLSEERLKKLEDDQKKLQKLRIKVGDFQRDNESLASELRHKKMLQQKNEEKIRDLRKELAVTQEKVGEKEVFISSLSSKLQEAKTKLENSFLIITEKENLILDLKEEKLHLEASLNTANEDKNLVDLAISKLKEDMNKLTSNYYRMKHDIVAKDRQIEIMRNENSILATKKLDMTNKLRDHNALNELQESYKILQGEINLLQKELKKVDDDKNNAYKKVNDLERALASNSIEKKNSDCALKLRDEQIINLQSINDSNAIKLKEKSQEISSSKNQIIQFEESYNNLLKQYSYLNEEVTKFQKEKEEFFEERNNLQHSIENLKVNLKLEIAAKGSLEKKYKKLQEEIMSEKARLKCEIDNLNKEITFYKNELMKAKSTKENFIKTFNEVLKLGDFKKVQQSLCPTIKSSKSESSIDENVHIYPYFKSKKRSIVYCKSKSDDEIEEYESYNSLNFGINGLIQKLKSKSKENMGLSTKLSKQIKDIHFLKLENAKIAETLDLQNRRVILLEEKLNECNAVVLLKENECKDWKLKYDGLCDFIPQRDYNTKQAVALHHAQFQSYKGNQNTTELLASQLKDRHGEMIVEPLTLLDGSEPDDVCSLSLEEYANSKFLVCNKNQSNKVSKSSSESLGILDESVTSFSTNSPMGELEDTSTFTQSAADLRIQLSLTLHALKEKDRLINQLKYKLQIIPFHPEQNILPSIGMAAHESSDKNINQLSDGQVGGSIIITEMKSKLTDKETEIKELQNMLSEKISNITEIESKLEKKESEFRDKQRRYESNVKLLTRKLKEHMKGRRTCEKDLESMIQENERKIEGEVMQYNLLKERHIELEIRFQQLKSEKSCCERLKNEILQELEEVKKGLETQKSMNIELQKNLGQVEELRECLNSSKSQEEFLRIEIERVTKFNIELQDTLKNGETEKMSIIMQCQELNINIDNINRNILELNDEILKKGSTIELIKAEISNKIKEISCLNEGIVALKNEIKSLYNSISLKEASEDLSKKEIEGLKMEIDSLNTRLLEKNLSLEDFISKSTLLEKELKLREGIITANKQDIESLQYQLNIAKEDHSSTIALMNTKMINATEIENSLNERLKSTLEQKLFYQIKTTEFRTSLNAALSQLRGLKRPRSLTPTPVLASPSPLDTDSLMMLMEQCSKPPTSFQCLSSLTKRLSSLREEVSVLQQEINVDQNCFKRDPQESKLAH